MELVLRVALVDFGYEVGRTTTLVGLWPKARGLANVTSSTATGREFSIDRLALDAFTDDAAISVDVCVRTNVSSACTGSILFIAIL